MNHKSPTKPGNDWNPAKVANSFLFNKSKCLSYLFLKWLTVLAEIISFGSLFQYGIIRLLKKFSLLLLRVNCLETLWDEPLRLPAGPSVVNELAHWFGWDHFTKFKDFSILKYWIRSPRNLLSSYVDKPNIFKRSLYDKFLISGTSFVALCWTCSKHLISFFKCGFQIDVQYSSWGLTNAVYSLVNDVVVHVLNVLFSIPSLAYALFVINWMCSLSFELWLIFTLRSLWSLKKSY